MNRLCSIAMVAVWLSAAKGASAQGRDPAVDKAERAEALFREGTAAFEQRDFGSAYRAHRQAWDLQHSFKTAVGLAQVELELQKYRDAAEHLTFAVKHVPPGTDGLLQRNIEHGLAEAREHVGAVRVAVNVEGATIRVDGRVAGTSPLPAPLFVEPGTHRIEAAHDRYLPATATVTAIKKATLQISLPLEGPSGGERTQGEPAADTMPVIVALATGGALTLGALTTAVVFDLKAQNDADEIDALRSEVGSSSACRDPDPSISTECRRLGDAAEEQDTANRVATVSYVAAGVFAAATAAITVLLWPSSSNARRDAVAIQGSLSSTGAAAAITGRF